MFCSESVLTCCEIPQCLSLLSMKWSDNNYTYEVMRWWDWYMFQKVLIEFLLQSTHLWVPSAKQNKEFLFWCSPSGRVIEITRGKKVLSSSVRRVEDLWQSSGWGRVCTASFSHCCDQIPDQKQLEGGRFIVPYSLREYSSLRQADRSVRWQVIHSWEAQE